MTRDESERRRFPRLRLNSELGAAFTGQIIWPNLEASEIRDVSYRGFAATAPGLFSPRLGETADVRLELGLWPTFPVTARVAWQNLNGVGLKVERLDSAGAQILNRYMDAQLLAPKLKPVAPLISRARIARKSSTGGFRVPPTRTFSSGSTATAEKSNVCASIRKAR